MSSRGDHQSVPLSELLSRELANEKIEKPEITHGEANQSKKREDFTFHKMECQRLSTDGITMYSVYAIGPLRCWPGGLCLSRSIGDFDVGEFIVPVPYVKQIKEVKQDSQRWRNEKESNSTHLPSADLFEAQANTKQLQHELEGALQAVEKSQCCSPST